MKSKMPGFLLFMRDLLIILGVATLVGLAVSLILQSFRQVSNIYFIGGVISWVVAAVPVFTEIGGNARISIKNRKDTDKAHELIREREVQYRTGARLMYLYGLSGFILILLSLFTLPLS